MTVKSYMFKNKPPATCAAGGAGTQDVSKCEMGKC